MAMIIPWIANRMESEPNGHMFTGYTLPLFNLVALLWDIERNPVEKQRLILVDAPRSAVYHGYGDAQYLFRKRSRVPFASFGCQHGITTVGLRYNDPLDPASGCRKGSRVITGWQGTAELIAAAVRHSTSWKDLETIEISSELSSFNTESAVYEVWATSRRTRAFSWDGVNHRYHSGSVRFFKNRAYRLARVEVVRGSVADNGKLAHFEEVTDLTLYPDGYLEIHYVSPTIKETNTDLPAPFHLDLSNETMMKFFPHDDLELNVNWV